MSRRHPPALFHRMPYGFGPTPGPRQGPDGTPFAWVATPFRTTASVTYLSDGARLARLLPPGFTLEGEPLVTVDISYLTALEWLAGRGYNLLGVRFPARFKGARDEAVGLFLAVLWENLADPILSGREELGYAKLWCEIPEPRVLGGRLSYRGAWLGHTFVELELSELGPVAPNHPAVPSLPRNDGTLHYKYVPRTGAPGEADAAYATLTPATGGHATIDAVSVGKGAVAFRRSTWEQIPTMAHIVNALADLPVIEIRDARLVKAHGGKDLSDQRRLD